MKKVLSFIGATAILFALLVSGVWSQETFIPFRNTFSTDTALASSHCGTDTWLIRGNTIPNLLGQAIVLEYFGGTIYGGGDNNTTSVPERPFKSTDQGQTWVGMSLFPDQSASNDSALGKVQNIQSILKYGSTLFYGVQLKTHILKDQSSTGLYRSTDDGQTWLRTDDVKANVNSIIAVGSALYAGVSQSDTPGSLTNRARVYKSTDGGASWTRIYTFPTGTSVNVLYAQNGVLYAGLRASGNNFYTSTDGGNNWQAGARINTDENYGVNDIVSAGGKLFAAGNGGTRWGGASGSVYVFRSDNGGASWEQLLVHNRGGVNYASYDFVYDGGTLYIASDYNAFNNPLETQETSYPVFASSNLGDNWSTVGPSNETQNSLEHGLALVRVNGLNIAGGTHFSGNSSNVYASDGAPCPLVGLTVVKNGSGSGTVTSAPVGISCGTDCTENYEQNTVVNLTQTPASTSAFAGWSGGGCTGTGTVCTVTMDVAKTVTATFRLAQCSDLVDNGDPEDSLTDYSAVPGQGDPGCSSPGDDNETLQNVSTGVRFGSSQDGVGGLVRVSPIRDTATSANCINQVTCSYYIDTSISASLAATADSGYRFEQWFSVGSSPFPCGGAQLNNPTCTFTKTTSWEIAKAQFRKAACNDGIDNDGDGQTDLADSGCPNADGDDEKPNLTVTLTGAGTGSVSSSPPGINCASDCSEPYTTGTSVTLTAVPAAGASFTGWSGACSGTTTTCTVVMSSSRSVTANFSQGPHLLTVTKAGDGTGTVTSAPTGISCGTDCSESYAHNTSVTLTASPAVDNTFMGWSGGGCTGTVLTCAVTMDAAKTVTANFASNIPLTVTKAGGGTGTVTSAPTGINCGSDCFERYAPNTSVTLTAAPSAGSVFTGWSGACSGTTTTCTVTMDAAKTATATFSLSANLTVAKNGTGSGTVTSSPVGINCGADCTESYVLGTTVTLTASPDSGSQFISWSSNCTPGAGNTCTTTMSAAKTVTATFNINQHTLNVTKTGTGVGTVTSSPAGIDCGIDCTQDYNEGTQVTLTASATSGSTFTGWSGACSGTASTCLVMMDLTKTATANFTADPVLNVTKTGTGSGAVTSAPTGINCGVDCSESYAPNSTVTLTATPSSGSTFTGWSGACSGTTTTCTVTMDAAKTATAAFNPSHLLTVTKDGNGGGTVTSSPAGISCGSDCSEGYTAGTVVTLTAASDASSRFVSWSANCTPGSGNTCTTTVNAAMTVTATFSSTIACNDGIDNDGDGFIDFGTGASNDPGCASATDGDEGYPLQVSILGNGNGSVSSNPIGVTNCSRTGGDCVEHYDIGTSVLLTATTPTGSTFIRWTGACTGTDDNCTVVMSAIRNVSAEFNAHCSDGIDNDGDGFIDYGTGASNDPGCASATDQDENPRLEVLVSGSGTVGSTPSGITNCSTTGGDCIEHFNRNTFITLTATPGSGQFTTWSGCTVSATNPNQCTTTMGVSKTVSVTFSTALTATCTVSQSVAGIGDILTWSANPAGGSVPYSYLWSGTPGLPGETTRVVNLSYTSYGAKVGSVRVTDSTGAQVTSESCTNPTDGTGTTIKPELTTGIIGDGQSTGVGAVTDASNGVNCATSTCQNFITQGANVSLVFTPNDSTSLFVAWLGPSGPSPLCAQGPYAATCSFVMNGDYLVKAETIRTACADGRDNDGDGNSDMNDPGCSSPSDNDENDPPACSDGIDNDGDGLIDFGTAATNDPGCLSGIDTDEGYRLTVAVTGGGVVSATAPVNPSPNPPSITLCGATSGLNSCTEHYNSGTVATLTATPPAGQTVTWTNCTPIGNTCAVTMGASKTVTATFSAAPACSDGLDNDGDGLIDFGTGATNDPGCSSGTDTDEGPKLTVAVTGGGSVSSTPTGIDACRATSGDCTQHFNVGTSVTLTATPPAGQATSWSGCTVSATNPNQCTTTMNTSKSVTVTFGNALAATCTVSRVDARIGYILTWTANATGGSGEYTYVWSGTGGLQGETTEDVNLSYNSYGLKVGFVTVTDSGGAEVDSAGCSNPGGGTGVTIKPELTTGIIGDGQSTGSGRITDATNGVDCAIPTCFKLITLNADVSLLFTPSDATSIFIGWVDAEGASLLCREGPYSTRCSFKMGGDYLVKAQVVRTACFDDADNDGDGLYDEEDPGCSDPTDDDESNVPECLDGEDNDGDGLTDDADLNCQRDPDGDEGGGDNNPECSDGDDNDGDGRTDYPADPGCSGPSDDNENNLPACSDGADNDGDDESDDMDPGCTDPLDDDETDPPACSDGADNDGDEFTDASDPECSGPNDNDEGSLDIGVICPADGPGACPACNDGEDNDGDGEADYPGDRGCRSRTDGDETDFNPDRGEF